MDKDYYSEKNRNYEEIRSKGAIGNLNEGIEMILYGIPTRIIAWPGNGFQTESIHVLTLHPGLESEKYCLAYSEEALLCLKGTGEVFLRNQWVTLEAGDIAYFPEMIEHGVRNPKKNNHDFVLISSITPPLLDQYESGGFYLRKQGMMNLQAIQQAKGSIIPGQLSTTCELHYNESYPELRAWNLPADDVRQHGALFNFYKGANFDQHGGSMRFILWPAYGTRSVGFHSVHLDPGQIFTIHTHPVSDECIISFSGHSLAYIGDRWVEFSPNDCVLAPCGVLHGGPHNNSQERIWAGGFAAPPQLDLYLNTEYYAKGIFTPPPFLKH